MSEWKIGEAIQPKSTLTSLEDYLRQMNRPKDPIQVRVFRVPYKDATDEERVAVNDLFIDEYVGLKYPLSVGRLWIMRFVNNLPWKIKGEWCTRITWEPWEKICPGVFDRIPDGKKKKNPTPRTMENRLVSGNVMDVTQCIIQGVPGMFRFHTDSIQYGDILAVRAYGPYGKVIRAILGSYTNHNAMFVR